MLRIDQEDATISLCAPTTYTLAAAVQTHNAFLLYGDEFPKLFFLTSLKLLKYKNKLDFLLLR